MFDDSKRLDNLEAQVAALTKAGAAAAEANSKSFKEVAEKRQSLIDQLNEFLKMYNTEVGDLQKLCGDLEGQVKKLTQRVSTLETDMKKVKK